MNANLGRRHVQSIQLLVVGAGPVGLFAALCAARRGLSVIVIEQNFRSSAKGHASILHPSSLRLLGELGIGQSLLREGKTIERIALNIDGGPEKTLDLAQPALSISQSSLEELLLKELRQEDVEIRSPCEATTLTRRDDAVQVRVLRRELKTLGAPAYEGEWEPVESSLVDASFVIGADGYESRVRASLGIETVDVGPLETFAMFEGPSSDADSTMHLGFDGGLGSVTFPLPGQRARWGFQLGAELSALPDVDQLRSLLGERGSWRGQPPSEVDWSTTTHFERRLARRFGSGRTWLAGDAAHITSPFGGQSMNMGLSEAHDLVECMTACLLENRSPASLEQLSALRERDWHKLLGFNVHFDAPASAPGWLRAHARQIVPALPASGGDLQRLLQQLGVTVH